MALNFLGETTTTGTNYTTDVRGSSNDATLQDLVTDGEYVYYLIDSNYSGHLDFIVARTDLDGSNYTEYETTADAIIASTIARDRKMSLVIDDTHLHFTYRDGTVSYVGSVDKDLTSFSNNTLSTSGAFLKDTYGSWVIGDYIYTLLRIHPSAAEGYNLYIAKYKKDGSDYTETLVVNEGATASAWWNRITYYDGNIYIYTERDRTIRKYNVSSGVITTVATFSTHLPYVDFYVADNDKLYFFYAETTTYRYAMARRIDIDGTNEDTITVYDTGGTSTFLATMGACILNGSKIVITYVFSDGVNPTTMNTVETDLDGWSVSYEYFLVASVAYIALTYFYQVTQIDNIMFYGAQSFIYTTTGDFHVARYGEVITSKWIRVR